VPPALILVDITSPVPGQCRSTSSHPPGHHQPCARSMQVNQLSSSWTSSALCQVPVGQPALILVVPGRRRHRDSATLDLRARRRRSTAARRRELTTAHCLFTNHAYYYCCFLTPVLNSQGIKKITLCNTEKHKNQAGMNLTPPPSQNSHAVSKVLVLRHKPGGRLPLLSARPAVTPASFAAW